ncbi:MULTISPECIES: hypothetical protein [Klebsiella]|uniref:hypothetical protein n=1 Tax=Klebsiella TaxID=570 RepID=UPI0015E9734E|nr:MULTISPECIES: hypothetical protein [Klebsiella]MBE8894305.1 hypothetical protein [Klebsiella grimontii]MBW6010400.1 hypothetical protein [Klebsiella sp. CVUAS 11263]MBW6033256.1 hypothetical protein [Klebsiella sp. CVUAS 11332]QLT88600.1 hypothetical protein HV252_15160 [Klebsiella grimontii]QQQ23739.1 hypothetical protein JIZ39_05325 [Klebsiella grimontii]
MTKSTITRERIEQYANDPRMCNINDEIREMARMALAAMDSEPVAYMYRDNLHSDARFSLESKIGNWSPEDINEYEITETPLYRHAQQPVVPLDVLEALQKVARIRLDMNDFDGDRRGIADCLGDAEEALIEVVNRRAAMLNGGKP